MKQKRKIVIIGLDAATWLSLDPVIQAGCMPKLEAMRKNGAYGILRSTEPHVTPAAWTTFISGVNPGKHGVFSFERLDIETGALSFTNSQTVKIETMYKYLSQKGYRINSLNLPQTYPPFQINGIMVSGYGCPGKNFECSYPAEFRDKFVEQVPDYDMVQHWDKSDPDNRKTLQANMDYCCRAFGAMYDLAKLAEQESESDILLAEIQQTDLLQHQIFGLLNPERWSELDDNGQSVKKMLTHLDDAIANLAGMASGPKDLVIVASDHGQCDFKAKVKPNILLSEWGYLDPKSSLDYLFARLKKNVLRMFGKKMSRGRGSQLITEKVLMNLGRTKAFVGHSAQHAFVYVNLKGRSPQGIVNPGSEYDNLVAELKEKFTNFTDPKTGENVFDKVQTPKEMFGISVDDNYDAGDLVLSAAPGYLPVRTMKGDSSIEYSHNDIGGTHSREGLYVFSGGSVKSGTKSDLDIADITPTIYALLGENIPDYVDGKPACDLFNEDLEVSFKTSDGKVAESKKQEDYTDQEQELISKRLADLGYLE